MSQYDFGTIDPSTKDGTGLATDLNAWRTALHSNHKGTSRPSYAVAGTTWINDSTNPLVLNFYDGADDIPIGSFNTTTNKFSLVTASVTNSNLAFDGGALGFRNKIINGDFRINQRGYVSGATVSTWLYGIDRWKMAASADTFTFSTTANKTTVTIPAGKVLRQVIEGLNLQTGTYTLSWEGTAQGKIGAGGLSASGITGSITGGTDTTIEFGPGTVANVQLEFGTVATPFEYRPYATELVMCQRYFQFLSYGQSNGQFYSTTAARFCWAFPTTMRAAPTLSVPTLTCDAVGAGATTFSGSSVGSSSVNAIYFDGTGGSPVRTVNQQAVHLSYASVSAEL